jgi:hypothetical protein
MGLSAAHFPFSRDVLGADYCPMAFHTFNNGFSVVDSLGRFFCYDLGVQRPTAQPDDGQLAHSLQRLGEAYLQVSSSHLQSIGSTGEEASRKAAQ